MPGCVLRVQSRTTRVEALVEASGLRPIVIYRKGQPRFLSRYPLAAGDDAD